MTRTVEDAIADVRSKKFTPWPGDHELLVAEIAVLRAAVREGVRPGCACVVCASHAAVIARAIEDATSPPAPAPERGSGGAPTP